VWDSFGSNVLGLYDTTTQTQSTVESFGNGPADMALEPSGNTLLVANAGSDYISRVNATTLADQQDLTIGARPDGLAYDDNGDLFAVLGVSEVAQIDPTTGAILNFIGNLSEADGLTFDSSTGMLYVGSDAGGFYTVDTGLTSAVFTDLGITTDGIASSGNLLYLINRGVGGVQYNLSDQSTLVSPGITGADDIAPVAGLGSQQTTPEPGSMMLLATGLLALKRVIRRKSA